MKAKDIIIQILFEKEDTIERRLEQIRANNPNTRNGLLYRNNTSGYKNLKNRQRKYKAKRQSIELKYD